MSLDPRQNTGLLHVIWGMITGTNTPRRVAVDADGQLLTSGDVGSPVRNYTGYSLTLTVADTQYTQALPANCRFFEFQARTPAAMRWAFVTGKVAGPVEPYRTLKAGNYYYSPDVNLTGVNLYFASAVALTIVEIIAWT